jgi:hypothetical protein
VIARVKLVKIASTVNAVQKMVRPVGFVNNVLSIVNTFNFRHMDITVTSATIATLISIITSGSISLWISSQTKKKSLDDQLDGILKIAIQYPYLEGNTFTLSWKPDFDEDNEKMLRYDAYCVLLFNYLSRVAKHYKFNKQKIEQYIAIKDWVRLHCKYWLNPSTTYENIDSYDKPFVNLINSYLI